MTVPYYLFVPTGVWRLRRGPVLALGETADWWGLSTQTDEVYLLRMRVQGMPHGDFVEIDRVTPWARAVGQSAAKVPWNLDVRGLAVVRDGEDWTVDVVLTATDKWVTLVGPSASVWAQDAIERLKPEFPGLKLRDAALLQLTGPAEAVVNWRSQPVMWDHLLGAGEGGPTGSLFAPADFNVVQGRGDAPPSSLLPWPKPLQNAATSAPSAAGVVVWIGAAAAGLLAYKLLKGKRKAQ